MSLSFRGSWVALSLVVFAFSCDGCSKTPVVKTNQCLGVSGGDPSHPNACTVEEGCSEHYSCKAQKDSPDLLCCVFADRACTTEADCCAGQACPGDRKKCFDKYVSCDRNEDCGDKGDRFCEVYTDVYGSSSRCRFKVCGPLGECADGQSCFNGECMADLPCGGSCEAGKACVPSTDRCQDYSAPPADRAAAACPMSCNAGFIATFQDARNIWDSCKLPDVKCVCAELPSLRSNDLGRFSALAADPGTALWSSTYDGQYGDLVVVKYGLDGAKLSTEYVDGVPAAAVKYGPSGARGGIVEPGNDVGRYTDIAVKAGGPVSVSYYDVTNGDLRFAQRGSDGKWKSHRVDGSSGDVGLYTSLALDSDGNPGISYFQKSGDATFNVADCPAPQPTGAKGYITALKFAHANTTTPTSDADWVVKTVACLSRPPPACDACTAICADPGQGPGCFQAGAGCTGCDPNTEACVSANSQSVCAKRYNPSTLVDVPMGTGVFSSLAFNGKEAVIAYMERALPAAPKSLPKGNLMGVKVSAANVPGAPVVLDASGDTGYFPDVKIDPGSKAVAIAYHDFSSRSLKYWSAPQLQVGVTPEVIDNGVSASAPGDQSWVGTDSALIFGAPGGAVYAVYQDPTRGDLKLAKRGAKWVVQTSLATEGAVGFFADGLFTDGKLYTSHARIHAKLAGGEPRVDNALLLESGAAP